MWQVYGNKVALRVGVLFATGCLFTPAANAQSNNENYSLPGVTLSQGTDEVRAADGTSCRTSVGGSGAYVDMGLIGKQGGSGDGSYYGRLVVPLGKGSKRLDCSKLYELEVERLRLELELAKAGLGQQVDPTLDQTETSAVEVEAEPTSEQAAEEVAGWDEENSIEEPAPKAPPKKKRAKAVAASEPEAPVKVAKATKLKKTKIGDADWATDGWSTDGRQTN